MVGAAGNAILTVGLLIGQGGFRSNPKSFSMRKHGGAGEREADGNIVIEHRNIEITGEGKAIIYYYII